MADLPVSKPALADGIRSLVGRFSEVSPAPSSARGVRLTPPLSAGVAAIGLAVVVVVVLFLSRGGAAAQIAPPAVGPSATVGGEVPGGLFVHVAGAVREPGLYELAQGARVADAIAAAGGALRKADVGMVNLAQPIADGMKIEVPERGAVAASPASTDGSTGSSALISINSAGLEELETLPGVGPVTAQAIISHREEVGVFATVEELLDVSGIGPATFAEIRPHVTL